MIPQDRFQPALDAIQYLVVRARLVAYERGEGELARLLDHIELLPNYIADDEDRTAEFRQMLESAVETCEGCAGALDVFDKLEAPDADDAQNVASNV